MAANFVPQGMLYSQGYGNMANTYRDRSAEQANSYGPQYNYQMDPFQSSNLGRYVPPTLTNPMAGADKWADTGGYSYNVPNSFGSAYGNSYNMFGPVGGFPTRPMQFSGMWNAPEQEYMNPYMGSQFGMIERQGPMQGGGFVPDFNGMAGVLGQMYQSQSLPPPSMSRPVGGQRPSMVEAVIPEVPQPAPGWGVRLPASGPFANRAAGRRAAGGL